ncbi:MAG: transcriptional repressor LexA [Verrucomicrobia bacterium]|nr:transcriptional repressor LexA [Verrucomicrobiota bacterium]
MLTQRQQEVLAFIQRQQRETGLPPTTREIQAHFGFHSQTAAMNHLRALQKKGAIRKAAGKARAAVVPQPDRTPWERSIPFLGLIPAGMPTDTVEETGNALELDLRLFGQQSATGVFALRVRGDSMINAQIADGDLVIVQQKQPREGDIVAALIDGEVTLKRYVMIQRQPRLAAENPRYPDLIPAADLQIQGVMIGLIRRA